MKHHLSLTLLALAGVAGAQDCTPELSSSLAPRGEFGAALTTSGGLLVVGAPASDSVPGQPSLHPYGRAELFEYDPTQRRWAALDVLGPPPSPLPVVNNAGFASALALAERTLFCGWPDDITGGNGSVRPFRRATPAIGWLPEPPLLPPVASATGRFGVAVAASGGTVAVGEQLSDGLVHLYERAPATGQWTHRQTLAPPAPGSLTGTFGRALALRGEWLFVGDPGHPGSLHGSGHVFVFRRDAAGVWQPFQRLSSANSNPLSADLFGHALDAAEDGALYVGAPEDVPLGGGPIGVVVELRLTGAPAQWTATQELASPAHLGAQSFGWAVDAWHDALLVGAPFDALGPAAVGAAHLFERDPVTQRWGYSGRYSAQSTTGVAPRAGAAVAAGAWQVALGAPGAERVRATPAYPTRDVDADGALDSCEALHDLTPCPALPNATGRIGRIHVDGTLDVLAAGTQLAADQLTPSSFGYFIVSRAFSVVLPPGGNQVGVLCLGGAVGRYSAHVLDSGPTGHVRLTIDPQVLPQPNGSTAALPGETWYFQYWHRDDVAVSGRITAFTETARVAFE